MNGLDDLIHGVTDELVDKVVPRPLEYHLLDEDLNPWTREIFVNDTIDEDFGAWFSSAMRILLWKSHDPITVWLNTPGGDMESMFIFHDVVRASPAEVTVVAQGGVASAGCLMLACAHKRLVTESCVLMWHQWHTEGVGGRYDELKARREYEDWLTDHWLELISRYVQPSDEQRDVGWWKRRTKAKTEWWVLGGRAIVEEGFADHLYSPELLPEPARRCYPKASNREG